MAELWHATIEVTDEIVKTCLEEQCPSLLPVKSIRCIGEGWDNKVFLVNDTYVFRFPRREVAVDLIERENKILQNLQAIQCVQIPRLDFLGKPTTLYPYPFHGYKIIPGVSACHAHLNEQERLNSLPVLSAFLKQLHDHDEKAARALGAESQVFDRIRVDISIETLRERVEKIQEHQIGLIQKDLFNEEMEKARALHLPGEDHCLVHGDLYCRHLMFNSGKLTGIIDWGDVGINNRSVDLSVIWSFYPKSAHRTFLELYGLVEPNTWQYARFLGLYSAITLLLYGSETKDELLVLEAKDSINRINPDLLLI